MLIRATRVGLLFVICLANPDSAWEFLETDSKQNKTDKHKKIKQMKQNKTSKTEQNRTEQNRTD